MDLSKQQKIQTRIEEFKNDNSVLNQPGVQRDNELRWLEGGTFDIKVR